MLGWAYGVTTVPVRRPSLLPRTLQSLKKAGFDSPRLFVDGDDDAMSWKREFGLDVVCRHPSIRTYGNWILALAELYIRDPIADRYAIFQDDFVTYRNLRKYLDWCKFPERGYWNLYTFPQNQALCPRGEDRLQLPGWFLSNQKGRGAVALVFDRAGVINLLHHQHMIERPQSVDRGWKAVDGGVVTAMQKSGWSEYVHNPTLVQHTGAVSSMRNNPHPQAISFKGETFDAADLITEMKAQANRELPPV